MHLRNLSLMYLLTAPPHLPAEPLHLLQLHDKRQKQIYTNSLCPAARLLASPYVYSSISYQILSAAFHSSSFESMLRLYLVLRSSFLTVFLFCKISVLRRLPGFCLEPCPHIWSLCCPLPVFSFWNSLDFPYLPLVAVKKKTWFFFSRFYPSSALLRHPRRFTK